MKTISEETSRLLDRAFLAHRGHGEMTRRERGIYVDTRNVANVIHMGRGFTVEVKTIDRPENGIGGWYSMVSECLIVEPEDGAWRVSRTRFGNPCGEWPIPVMFVGERAAFERDMAMLKMLLHQPVGDVRMAT